MHFRVGSVSLLFILSRHPPACPPSLPPSPMMHPSQLLNCQEYKAYKERVLKAENQLVNALGFDFMIEHPFSHSNDLVDYLCEEGKARGCQEHKLCVLCSGPGDCQASCSLDWRGRWCCVPFTDAFFEVPPLAAHQCLVTSKDADAALEALWRVLHRSIPSGTTASQTLACWAMGTRAAVVNRVAPQLHHRRGVDAQAYTDRSRW